MNANGRSLFHSGVMNHEKTLVVVCLTVIRICLSNF